MTIMTEEQIQARLFEIAEVEQELKDVANDGFIEQLETQKRALESKLKAVKDSLAYHKDGKALQWRDDLISDFDAHLQAGGDPKVHERIGIRRNKKWMFDQKAALAWAQENGIRDVIRTKETLDKRAFDELVKAGHYPDAEQVHSVSIIIPAKLGDLLIIMPDK